MSNVSSYEDAVNRLASQSDAVGRLAQDSGGFAAVVAAFESKDADAFRWVLERLEMLPYCELICEWVRIKMGVLRCIEVCGVPREGAPAPSLQDFARAVVRLASDEKQLRRVVDAVSCADREAYQAAIASSFQFVAPDTKVDRYRNELQRALAGPPAAFRCTSIKGGSYAN
jgi:hypothetical protein